jgi:hypothetical protein
LLSSPFAKTGGLGVKFLCLTLGLTLGCTLVLFVAGDFTPYVGEPDDDVWVIEPGPGEQLTKALAVAVTFAVLSALAFAITGRLAPVYLLTRLFLVTTIGFTAVVYCYGDFKTLFGDGRVFYELPWGAARFAISVGCGAALAAGATVACAACRTAWHKQSGARPQEAL